MTGSLAAAPVITTLANRPAWASNCTMVTMMTSVTHMSHAVETTCVGQSPEEWLMDPDTVAGFGVTPGLANPLDYNNVFGIPAPHDYSYASLQAVKNVLRGDPRPPREHRLKLREYRDILKAYPGSYPESIFGTRFNFCFETNYADPDASFMQTLSRQHGNLLAESCAAWCNACKYGRNAFGYAPEEVIMHFENLVTSDPILLHDAFYAMNRASSII